MTTERTRRCGHCRQRKPIGEFSRRRNGTYSSYCRRCDADRVWAYELERKELLGEEAWHAERAAKQRAYRDKTGNAYQKARRSVVTQMIHEHPEEFALLRQQAADEGAERPYDAARKEFLQLYRDDVRLRTQIKLKERP